MLTALGLSFGGGVGLRDGQGGFRGASGGLAGDGSHRGRRGWGQILGHLSGWRCSASRVWGGAIVRATSAFATGTVGAVVCRLRAVVVVVIIIIIVAAAVVVAVAPGVGVHPSRGR